MTKETLTLLKRTPRTSARTGKSYTSLSIKTREHGDRFLSGFSNKDNEGWQVGDSVEIEVKTVEKDGTEYLNFETAKTNVDRSPAANNGATAELKNILEFKVVKLLEDLNHKIGALSDRLDVFIDEENIQPKFD